MVKLAKLFVVCLLFNLLFNLLSSFLQEATHDWEFFIRDKNKGDMKLYTEKIIVNLHETFKNPTRGLQLSVFFWQLLLLGLTETICSPIVSGSELGFELSTFRFRHFCRLLFPDCFSFFHLIPLFSATAIIDFYFC